MSFATRYAIPRTARIARRAAMIPEERVFSRVLTAIRALKALPDKELRFLYAGKKSGWVQTLVEWADLVAQAELPRDDHDARDRWHPTRAEISDAMIAGEWFAKLAVLPENVDEFEKRLGLYRASLARTAQVEDQRILVWVASGLSLKLIGERLGRNEHQIERRIAEIRNSLWQIANGTARLADVEARERQRKSDKARHFGG